MNQLINQSITLLISVQSATKLNGNIFRLVQIDNTAPCRKPCRGILHDASIPSCNRTDDDNDDDDDDDVRYHRVDFHCRPAVTRLHYSSDNLSRYALSLYPSSPLSRLLQPSLFFHAGSPSLSRHISPRTRTRCEQTNRNRTTAHQEMR